MNIRAYEIYHASAIMPIKYAKHWSIYSSHASCITNEVAIYSLSAKKETNVMQGKK
jgi:hypothetical protein